MMKKPEGYDEAKAISGDFKNPVAGPYVLGIIKAEIGLTKETGKAKLVLSLDIAKGEFKNYYRELSEKMKKDCYLKIEQVFEGEKSLPYFKGLIKAIEESNQGYIFNFDEKTLVRKLVGAMLQEKHYVNGDGKRKSILKVYFVCSVAKAESGTLKTPNPEFPEDDSMNPPQDYYNQAPQDDIPF
jgi:hypothetical protein